jgi:hypothetical protein
VRRNPERSFFLVPVAQVCNLQSIRFGDSASELTLNDLLTMLLEDVGAALQEEHPEDVFLKFRRIHLAA